MRHMIITNCFAIKLQDGNIICVKCPQEVVQSAGTTPHEAEVTSSNPPSPSYVDMSKIYIYIYIICVYWMYTDTI
jgi:hypothetical protein